MTTSRLEGEPYFQQSAFFYNEQLNKMASPILLEFEKMMKSYVLFNFAFFLTLTAEIISISFFFTYLIHSSLVAFALALIFLTLFSYFVLKVYFQTKKPEQYRKIESLLVEKSKEVLGYQEGVPECHIALANACSKLAECLKGKEYRFYKIPSCLKRFADYAEKFSCWWHWHDLLCIKELLLNTSVAEHIKLVKCEPTSLEAHASLANAYVMLSTLYADPAVSDEEDVGPWSPVEQYAEVLQRKFRATAEKAVEEFKILSDYAPNDPWVHIQLAYSYRDMQMPLEEIKQYEIILKLNPDDMDTLYKLGVLYFQLGRNAQGLQVYEKLKAGHFKKAEMLIKHYGALLNHE